MASLDPTERAKVALAAGESLRVTTSGQCTVQGLTGAPATTTTLTANSQNFGPYGVSAVLLITGVSGRSEYSLNVPAASGGAVPGDGVLAPVVYRDQVAAVSGAPTITKTGTTAPVGLSPYGEASPVFDYLGVGPWLTHSGDSAMRRPAVAAAYSRVNWVTDEPDSTILLLNAASNYQLFYDEYDGDGWKYAGTITTTASGSREYAQIVFSTRRPRRFSLRGFNFTFGGVFVPTTGLVLRDEFHDATPIAMVTGDSYTQSTGAAGQAVTWAAAFVHSLGCELFADGIGSTGLASDPATPVARYFARGPGALVRRNSGIETACPVSVAFYALGYNDSVGSVPVMQAAMSAVIAVCTVKPTFIGPWTPLGDTADLTTKAAAIEATATAEGCRFVSAAGIVTAVNKSALTGGDNVHPTQYGHNYIGLMLARRVRAAGIA